MQRRGERATGDAAERGARGGSGGEAADDDEALVVRAEEPCAGATWEGRDWGSVYLARGSRDEICRVVLRVVTAGLASLGLGDKMLCPKGGTVIAKALNGNAVLATVRRVCVQNSKAMLNGL